MEKAGKIYQQIPKVMADIDAIAKNRKNESQNFKFRGIDDVYNEIHAKLAKHGVFTVPIIIGRHRENLEKKTIYQGQEKTTRGVHIINNFRFRFYADDGSFIEADADGEAIDWGGDKASNKSASIAHKYALLQVFCIPTDEPKDPDQWNESAIPVAMFDPPKPKKNALTGVSDDQKRLLFVMAQKKQWSTETMLEHFKSVTGTSEVDKWTQIDFQKVLKSMQ